MFERRNGSRGGRAILEVIAAAMLVVALECRHVWRGGVWAGDLSEAVSWRAKLVCHGRCRAGLLLRRR